MVRITTTARKKLFLASLELAEMQVKVWCEARDISTNQLYAVLSGKRESRRLTADVDEFIAQTIRSHRRELALAS